MKMMMIGGTCNPLLSRLINFPISINLKIPTQAQKLLTAKANQPKSMGLSAIHFISEVQI
jgi:hypothetical protein